jgi:DsbC/DsbD-like thiol-disulfide interchange protein
VRLIAAPVAADSLARRAGVEIHLATGALTYWRTPGGAGVAPVFDFSGSENVAKVDLAYPAPSRIEEEGTEVYGYQDTITFPLRLEPHEPGRAMRLALSLSYAVCDRICLPAKATVHLDLPSPASSPLPEDAAAIAIARAEASVPQRLSDRERDTKLSIEPVAGASLPSWRVIVREEPMHDLFAEAEDGWYFETKKTEEPGAFLIVQAEKPTAAGDDAVPVTLTLTGPKRSYELRVMLDRETAGR